MSENELAAIKWIQCKNIALAFTAGLTTTSLFYISNDWFALFGMLPLLMISAVSTK